MCAALPARLANCRMANKSNRVAVDLENIAPLHALECSSVRTVAGAGIVHTMDERAVNLCYRTAGAVRATSPMRAAIRTDVTRTSSAVAYYGNERHYLGSS